jgi:hypothetical protein
MPRAHSREYENLFKWLRNGDSRDANVNGSSTPVEFSYTVPAGSTLAIARMIIYIQDTGNFNAAQYGNGVILTEGIDIEHLTPEAVTYDLLDGEDILTNGHWAAMSHDLSYLSFGTGDNIATVRWSFDKTGAPLILHEGHTFIVRVNDDLTTLSAHHFNIQGLLT